MKKIAAAKYLTLFRDFKLARMIKTYRSASCHQGLKIRERTYANVISKIIKQYFDIKLSKGLLHPNLIPFAILQTYYILCNHSRCI